jgi:chemotaxis protein MotB
MNRVEGRRSSRGEAAGAVGSRRPSADRWLLSYADFVTLLLALFVVLYAGAVVQDEEKALLLEGLQSAFMTGIPIGGIEARTPLPSPPPDASAAGRSVVDRLESGFREMLEQGRHAPGDGQGIALRRTERGLVISLASTAFFTAGGAEIPAERQETLSAMVPLLKSTNSSILFEGHTDPSPLRGGPYPSNWELSSARAAAVARLFIDDHGLSPERVTTTGHAGFQPLHDNTSEEGRARNRRVEIVILSDGEWIEGEETARDRGQLDALLAALPPLPDAPDEGLRAPDPGPPPAQIPLP